MIERLTEPQRLALWIQGTARQLVIWGLLQANGVQVTDKGLAVWDQLDKRWKPSDDQLAWVAKTQGPSEGRLAFLSLLTMFRDNREVLEAKARVVCLTERAKR